MRNNEERLGAAPQRQDNTPPQSLQLNDSKQPQAGGLNFIVPTEFIALPSKGKFYPSHHPLHGKDTIEIKQMTAKEEDILTSRSLLKKGVAIDRLIQSLVVDKNINTDTLTVEDRNAIVINARISAYGAEYETSVVCPECNEKSKNVFNLLERVEKEETKELNITVDANGHFTVLLPSTKWTVVCRALNGYDEKLFLKNSEQQQKKNLYSDNLLLDQLKSMVVSMQGVDDRQAISLAIEAMPASDAKFLRRAYSDAVLAYDMTHTFTCKSCDAQSKLEVPLTADFFWFK